MKNCNFAVSARPLHYKQKMKRTKSIGFIICASSVAFIALMCSQRNEISALPEDFNPPSELPMLQLIVDEGPATTDIAKKSNSLQSLLERMQSRKSAPPRTRMQIGRGLLVPVTSDGYCLTAAHNVASEREIYVPVDLANLNNPFIDIDHAGNPLFYTVGRAYPDSGLFTRQEIKKQGLELIQGPVDNNEYRMIQEKLKDFDSIILIPLKVIKIWKADDLALVKAPFQVRSHFRLAKEKVALGEAIMCFGSPIGRSGNLNITGRRVRAVLARAQTDLFYTLYFNSEDGFLKKGDSGGPVINVEGELVGIHTGTNGVMGRLLYNRACGINKDILNEAINESRGAVESGA